MHISKIEHPARTLKGRVRGYNRKIMAASKIKVIIIFAGVILSLCLIYILFNMLTPSIPFDTPMSGTELVELRRKIAGFYWGKIFAMIFVVLSGCYFIDDAIRKEKSKQKR